MRKFYRAVLAVALCGLASPMKAQVSEPTMPPRPTFTLPSLRTRQSTAVDRGEKKRTPTAFVGVNVVDPATGDVRTAQTVLVDVGKIQRVGPTASVTVPREVTRIDATDLYLIPGMISPSAITSEVGGAVRLDDALLLYLSRGITSVRWGSGAATPATLEALAEGQLPAPRIVSPIGAMAAVQAGKPSGAAQWLLDGTIAAARISADGLLRALTTEAAEDMGLRDRLGSVEAGRVADLVLLGGNPVEDRTSLQRIRGVMVDGWWWPDSTIVKETENRAREAVIAYRRAPNGASGTTCVGITLYDCLGGEQLCAVTVACDRSAATRERAVLRLRLEYLARIAPDNDVIIGQRVNAAVESEDFPLAVALSDTCTGALWWCQALRGYTRNWQRPGSGDAHFDSVSANVPPRTLAWMKPGDSPFDERLLACEWHDLQYVISGDLLGEYRRVPCGGNLEFEALFWWLSDPLWSVPGNSRYGEHQARIVQMMLHDQQGIEKGDHDESHHFAIMGPGLPNSWRTVQRMAPLNLTDTLAAKRVPRAFPVRELYTNHGYHFTPTAQLFRDPLASSPDDWQVEKGDEGGRYVLEIWPASYGAPAKTKVVAPGDEQMVIPEDWYDLESQTALLRRGDRMLVLTAALPPTLLGAFGGAKVDLAFGRPSDRGVQVFEGKIEGSGISRAQALIADEPIIESLEVQGAGWIGRVRQAVSQAPLVNRFGISQPVLVAETFEVGEPLLDGMLASTDLGASDAVGVYFETYGATQGEKLRIQVSAVRIAEGVLGRLADAVGLTGPGRVGAYWEETVALDPSGVFARVLPVSLVGLESGRYRIEMTVLRPDGTTTTTSRVIRVSR